MKRHIDYVVVNVNGDYANVYDFCTPETAEEIIEKATEQARKTVATYNSHIVNYPERADYWKSCKKQYETENNCYGIYNPQSKRSDDGKRNVINFDWIFEATEENKQKLLEEVYNRFMAATGKTATEKKIENVYNHAKKCGHEVYKELPEGWKMLKGTYAPLGSVLISNGKSFRDKERKEALLLI